MTSDKPNLISVILSTYNNPAWLEKSVWGYAAQHFKDFELVIADDGSERETKDLVQRLRSETGLNLTHVWHPDDGFQKCKILNSAIAASNGDYLVFSDGDCIPRSDFLQHHFDFSEPGRFLSGGYYKLPMDLSESISLDDIRSGRVFDMGWLRRSGLPFSHRWIRLIASGRLSRALNAITTTRPTWNGNNSSGWADDLKAAGGFDQRMRYGGEDRELGERLENSGVRGKHVRYQTVCLHLDHPRGYANEDDWRRNNQIRKATREQRLTRTSHGLSLRQSA